MNSNKAIVILAGGLGSRYKGLKQIEGITENNSPILEYSIYDALEAGFNKVILVLNKNIPETYLERLKEIAASQNINIQWVFQDLKDFVPENYDVSFREKPWGTGHALLCAKNLIHEPFVVINGDDFYGKEIYQKASKIIDENLVSDATFHIITYPLHSTMSENGSVSRGICDLNQNGTLNTVTERTKIIKEDSSIFYIENNEKFELKPETLVSMNFSIFNPNFLDYLENQFQKFISSQPSSKEEFFIPKQIQNMIDDQLVSVKVHTSPSQWMGITYPEDKTAIKEYIENEIELNRYPKNLWK